MINEIPFIKHTGSGNFFLLAGPCVVEDTESPVEIARILVDLCDKYEIPFIFKASYRKANRSKSSSFTGIGDEKALEVLAGIRQKFGVPVVSDIHSESDARMAAQYIDVLQIPAFLCRQSDILVAAGETGKVVNIKKGQFASGDAMHFAVEKVRETRNNKVMLTERGTTFGYTDLVVDFRNIPVMQQAGVPVILDVTHSLQQPNQPAGVTGGRPDLIPLMARLGIASGVEGLFMETHPDPSKAKSDGANMLRLDLMDELLAGLVKLRKALI
ncbi:MAG TPA: 3-deoxy-8-phosphooctulonate synthase [Bacteroidales bacterium]|nr:3-deoxy-8-phosphooctulonate synthase [Bacteroidales bacterium]